MSVGQDLKKRLREQLGFLQRSADAFDQGHREEALRIATVLRVIFHDTSNSMSILTLLNAPNVAVRSEVPDRTKHNAALGWRKIVGEFSWSLASITLTRDGKFLALTNVDGPHRMIAASDWWGETFAHVEGVDYTRKKVILFAANKDGGAHVDPNIPLDYEDIRKAGAIGYFEMPDGSNVDIEDAHYTFLRTMAFEVLNSQNLAALGR